MLMFAIVLAVASTIVEMMFAVNFPVWRRLAHDFKWFNMTVSIVLSFIIGLAFGAGGLIAMTAGLISTVLSIPGYSFLHWNMDSEKAQALGQPRTTHAKKVVSTKVKKTSEVVSDLGKIAYGTGKVITAPFWVPRRMKTAYRNRYPRSA